MTFIYFRGLCIIKQFYVCFYLFGSSESSTFFRSLQGNYVDSDPFTSHTKKITVGRIKCIPLVKELVIDL